MKYSVKYMNFNITYYINYNDFIVDFKTYSIDK